MNHVTRVIQKQSRSRTATSTKTQTRPLTPNYAVAAKTSALDHKLVQVILFMLTHCSQSTALSALDAAPTKLQHRLQLLKLPETTTQDHYTTYHDLHAFDGHVPYQTRPHSTTRTCTTGVTLTANQRGGAINPPVTYRPHMIPTP
jgi:hypothetical protein